MTDAVHFDGAGDRAGDVGDDDRVGGVGGDGGRAGDGGVDKAPPALPTDMFSLDPAYQGNDGAVVAAGGYGVSDRAAVADTVATVGGDTGDGAAAAVTVTSPDDETIDLTGNIPKSSFPRTRESRTNNPAQPTEFNAGVGGGGADRAGDDGGRSTG